LRCQANFNRCFSLNLPIKTFLWTYSKRGCIIVCLPFARTRNNVSNLQRIVNYKKWHLSLSLSLSLSISAYLPFLYLSHTLSVYPFTLSHPICHSFLPRFLFFIFFLTFSLSFSHSINNSSITLLLYNSILPFSLILITIHLQ